jgi:predicted metal-dependent enzyme (double-stranded beta helix superfamily)
VGRDRHLHRPRGQHLLASRARRREKDAEPLGHRIIHSVTNPIPRFTGAIHVYGGDFFGVSRSEWDAESLVEGEWDTDRTMRRFEEANARARATAG